MIVNKSMFPLQTGFSVISKMQDKFATLQMQLGTGKKAQTLADMGRDLPVSLSVRSRLNTIAGYNANIETVALRLSFFDNALTRFDKIEGEARNSAMQGQYGTNNINMATIPDLSKARFDEIVTMLNSDIAGRYLFGGSTTDKAPLPTSNELLNGVGGRAGYQTLVTERRAADAGVSGLGRVETEIDPLTPNVVTLSEDGVHPFGFKLSTVATTSGNVIVTQPSPGTLPQGNQVSFTFGAAPDDQIRPNQTITLGFTLPDGTETQITLRATDAANATGAANEFVIGDTADDTALAFEEALNATLSATADTELAAASTFAAAQNFFNGPGEPVLRVSGDPATATSLRLATATDTVMWYKGESPAVSATGMGRLSIANGGDSVSMTENVPVSAAHGFRITAGTSEPNDPDRVVATHNAGTPAGLSVQFGTDTEPGDSVTLTLTEPNGKQRVVTLTAVEGKATAGQFSLGGTPDKTAANFQAALTRAVTQEAADAEGNPRQSVSSAVEDSGRVNYGMQANESGYLRLIRTMAAMSVETYPEVRNATDPDAANLKSAKLRFDAMARRQQLELSESHNAERGSIEIVTMELGVARASLQSAGQRHTNYKAQLDNLLSDVETVSKEDVAMEIMALQVRLTASYQVTSMVSQLSLVNFLR